MYQVTAYKRKPDAKDPDQAYDPRLVTKLLSNYRSHPVILKTPNDCFYNGELKACADLVLAAALCQWEGLPRKGFPVMFHGVLGEDQREERSPSFFNAEEVDLVLKYVQSLASPTAKGKGIRVGQKDIAVISPYRKQVKWK